MEFIIGLIITFALLVLGVLAGGMAERKHFRQIAEREFSTSDIIRTNSKNFLAARPGGSPPTLICAETVVASDYFKNFLAYFRKIFGGEMKSYNTLMDRARRETLLRLIEQARANGYNAICNVRLEPADIGGNLGKKQGSAMVSILGTATAYHSDIAIKQMPKPVNLE